MNIDFTFSDTIAGYASNYDPDTKSFISETSDGRKFKVSLLPQSNARGIWNHGESYVSIDAEKMEKMLSTEGQFVYCYGVFYPAKEGEEIKFEAQTLIFPSTEPGKYEHEENPNWYIDQIEAIADSYLKWQFNYPEDKIDYRNYRTHLHLAGEKDKEDVLQETDTISRLVFGFASAYMLTGKEEFLEAAEKGTNYLREHMRFYDQDESLTYWYHGIKLNLNNNQETKLLTSEFGDDYHSIPMYEQIYALAGPTQTYRITGDKRIMEDIENTIDLFEKYYKDDKGEGYFSHIDPIDFDPRASSLNDNRARKNWNSVGDHAPAYLVNLYLATEKEEYAKFLEYTFDTITKYFPDYENSPFVQERFFEDWSKDQTWGWQQNRAVVGHNLKIAWNLMRMHSINPKESYEEFAFKIAKLMPDAGSDQQRGGWYDVLEREAKPNNQDFQFVWHDRKA